MRVPMTVPSFWQRVAIMGAPGTGKSWLTHALTEVLRARGDTVHQEALSVAAPTRQDPLHNGKIWLISDNPPLGGTVPAAAPAARMSPERMPLHTALHGGGHDLALVMGLDVPSGESGASEVDAQVRARIDTDLRQTLLDTGQDFRVIYGQGLARLNQALIALGLPAQDKATWPERASLQFALNAGRTPWSCEKCSDPDCEHRLFSRLLRQRPSDTGQS